MCSWPVLCLLSQVWSLRGLQKNKTHELNYLGHDVLNVPKMEIMIFTLYFFKMYSSHIFLIVYST